MYEEESQVEVVTAACSLATAGFPDLETTRTLVGNTRRDSNSSNKRQVCSRRRMLRRNAWAKGGGGSLPQCFAWWEQEEIRGAEARL